MAIFVNALKADERVDGGSWAAEPRRRPRYNNFFDGGSVRLEGGGWEDGWEEEEVDEDEEDGGCEGCVELVRDAGEGEDDDDVWLLLLTLSVAFLASAELLCGAAVAVPVSVAFLSGDWVDSKYSSLLSS